MKIAILDERLIIVAGDTPEQTHNLIQSQDRIRETLAPWKPVIIGPGVEFLDLRDDPALAADVAALAERIAKALPDA